MIQYSPEGDVGKMQPVTVTAGFIGKSASQPPKGVSRQQSFQLSIYFFAFE